MIQTSVTIAGLSYASQRAAPAGLEPMTRLLVLFNPIAIKTTWPVVDYWPSGQILVDPGLDPAVQRRQVVGTGEGD